MQRALSLKREQLTELTPGELAGVAGAAYDASGLTCPVKDCVAGVSDAISCRASCAISCICSVEVC